MSFKSDALEHLLKGSPSHVRNGCIIRRRSLPKREWLRTRFRPAPTRRACELQCCCRVISPALICCELFSSVDCWLASELACLSGQNRVPAVACFCVAGTYGPVQCQISCAEIPHREMMSTKKRCLLVKWNLRGCTG